MALDFIKEYARNIKTVGAVAPSSQQLARAMIESIDFSQVRVIVELGAGTGSFTREIMNARQENTTVVVIEYNDTFYKKLVEMFASEPHVYIYHGSAEDIDGVLAYYKLSPRVDAIVSGLPFASLPREQSQAILERSSAVLAPGGLFVTFQYTLLKKSFIASYFDKVAVRRVWRNVPPAYVLECRNK
jgi:phospholipid N-methyltransferase